MSDVTGYAALTQGLQAYRAALCDGTLWAQYVALRQVRQMADELLGDMADALTVRTLTGHTRRTYARPPLLAMSGQPRRVLVSHARLLTVIRDAVARQGLQKHAAAAWGVPKGHVSDVLKGYRAPNLQLLAALGYQRVVMYERETEREGHSAHK